MARVRSGVADKIVSRLGIGHKPLATFSPTEVAWAAGFFDGEGTAWCVLPSGKRRDSGRRARLRLQTPQCDRRSLSRIHAALGDLGTLTGPYTRRSTKAISYWQACGKDAGKALSLLWPYLGEAKREQAKAALKKAGEYNRVRA